MDLQPEITAAVAGGREAMEGFLAAFNAQDGDAVRTRWFHFPHVRFHSGTVTIMERPEDFRSTVWERKGEAEGWARTEWDYVEPVDAGPKSCEISSRGYGSLIETLEMINCLSKCGIKSFAKVRVEFWHVASLDCCLKRGYPDLVVKYAGALTSLSG